MSQCMHATAMYLTEAIKSDSILNLNSHVYVVLSVDQHPRVLITPSLE